MSFSRTQYGFSTFVRFRDREGRRKAAPHFSKVPACATEIFSLQS